MNGKIFRSLFAFFAVNALVALSLCHSAFCDVKSTHGELLFSDAKISAVKTSADYTVLRDRFISAADYVLNNTAHPVEAIDIDTTDLRHYEKYIMRLVMAYKITDDSRYFDKAVGYLQQICAYPSWDWWAGDDLVTSHLIMGLSFAYDYLYAELDSQLREDIKNRLLQELDKKVHTNHAIYFDDTLSRRSTLLGNHLWINNTAVYQAAVALRNDIPAAAQAEYVNTTTEMMMNKVMHLLPKDGSGQEVSAYSLYGLHYMLQFLELKKRNEGLTHYSDSDYFKYIMYYMHHNLFPDHSIWVNIADHSNTSYWYSPHSYCFLLADEFNDPVLQHIALYYSESSPMIDTYPMFSLFWFDPALVPQLPATGIPKIAFFEENGQVAYRTSWSDEAMYVNFICGKLKTGHSHPDQNSFLVYHKGNHLITDQGYSYWKTTGEHSTLVVDDYGQIGENYIWLPGDIASDLADTYDFYADENNLYAHFTGDASNAYRVQCDLDLFRRHFVILGNYIIIFDRVRTFSPKTMEIRFHNSDLSEVVDEVNRFTLSSASATAILTVSDSQMEFYFGDDKEAQIAPTYFVPPMGYPGLTSQELYSYLRAYYQSEQPYDGLSVKDVLADFTSDGFPPPQHGYHLSQKTVSPVTEAVFKNLLLVKDTGTSSPVVSRVDNSTVTGFVISEAGRKITCLFNKSLDMNRKNTYGSISFVGCMVVSVDNISMGTNKTYTKNATIVSSGFLLGDVNQDGKVRAYDAALAARYAIGLEPDFTEEQILAANFDGIGGVNAYDAALIARKSIGL